MIADCCSNKLITKLILSLIIQTRYFQGGIIRAMNESIKEHLDVLYALEKRDSDLSEIMMRKHIRNTKVAFLHGVDEKKFEHSQKNLRKSPLNGKDGLIVEG
jgi:DNA-binding GntR family transcriptional regulator